MPPGMIESPTGWIDAVLLHDLVVELPRGSPAHADAGHDEVGAGKHRATVGRADDADACRPAPRAATICSARSAAMFRFSVSTSTSRISQAPRSSAPMRSASSPA